MTHIKSGPNQLELFDQKFNTLVTTARELIQPTPPLANKFLPGDDIAACYTVASACKRAIERAGYSRAQMVDKINKYWGRTENGADAEEPECLKPLSSHTFNNYLSKPQLYRIPAIYVIAIESICQNLEISRSLVEAQGGQVINSEEAKHLKLAQVQQAMHALSIQEKELKKMVMS